MSKFFRRIRKNLILENKTGRYFKYAVGEILLVVIGILIALQINNANEVHKNDQRVERFLMKLDHQISRNLENSEYYLERFKEELQVSKVKLNGIYSDTITNLDEELDNLMVLHTFDYLLNLDMLSLEEARNNGDLGLLKSEALVQAVYKFIKINEVMIEREKVVNEDLTFNFKPYLNEHYNVRNLIYAFGFTSLGKSKLYKNDNAEILKHQEFENLLITRIMFAEEMVRNYEELIVALKDVRREIQIILDN